MASLEDLALAAGGPRIKFSCNPAKGDLKDELPSKQLMQFEALWDPLADSLVLLEETGAAPIAPDGALAGNASALLEGTGGSPDSLIVSRSSKPPGKKPAREDFVAVMSFDSKAWGCVYSPAKQGQGFKPTSDSPLHWAALIRAHAEFGWTERPRAVLHGHALEKEEEARALNIPISMEETMFSTPEDVEALMGLFKNHPYPQHRMFVRRGHGFLLLARSISEGIAELRKYIPHFQVPLPKHLREGTAIAAETGQKEMRAAATPKSRGVAKKPASKRSPQSNTSRTVTKTKSMKKPMKRSSASAMKSQKGAKKVAMKAARR
eukprot:gnl/TRDRNA2_/TRDRNA2_173397_c0_seq1.p1 gnl/TRDRNA2_/TRDRNA2_173397_c0~~gnl/TRDRNA2_/TRDRNA2_173397_c0_seq1.p1  ORF type:complete len:321 (-),score=62.89 gnl/TRDRNA2_/TRDRNA2_173397_c0_seq1:122-1084(-)